jgi:hypothetical protein
VCRYLVSRGADPTAIDDEGKAPLQVRCVLFCSLYCSRRCMCCVNFFSLYSLLA